MNALRELGRSCRAVFATFAATVIIASAGWLAMGTSKAATPEIAPVAGNEVVRSFTLKEWMLLAK